jgi:hypothetical protein
MRWFGAIGLFRHEYDESNRVSQYEERTVVLQASDEDAARDLVLDEFRRYATELEGVQFLDQFIVNEIHDPPNGTVTEVASLMRVTDLDPGTYIDRYWIDLRPSSCDQLGWTHVWHNAGGGRSNCYNCRDSRLGELWKK